MRDAARAGAVSRILTSELAAYLNRPVTVAAAPEPAGELEAPLWHFESDGGVVIWRLALEQPLARALVDVMLGGGGAPKGRTGSRSGDVRNTRVAAVAERVAHIFFAHLAKVAQAPNPGTARFVALGGPEVDWSNESVVIGGTCTIAGMSAGWRVRLAAMARQEVRRAASATPHAQGSVEGAAAAAMASIGALTKQLASLNHLDVELVATPTLPPGSLRLGLAASGGGALVLSANRQSIAALVGAALGVPLSAGGELGSVTASAGETILRAGLVGFGAALLGSAADPARVVRLAESAVPALSEHYAVTTRGTVGSQNLTLRWLVPTWMTAKANAARRR